MGWIDLSRAISVDTGTDIFTMVGSNWGNPYLSGQTVRFTTTGGLPAPLSGGTTYYIINPTSTTFQVSISLGGIALDITTAGTGTNSVKRFNGYAEDDLIQNPAYIIESILRDEVFALRGLVAGTCTTNNGIVDTDLLGGSSYYDYGIVYNITQNEKIFLVGADSNATTFDTGTKTLTTASGFTAVPTNNKYIISNINGDKLIDMQSFDKVGNTTNGQRDGWYFAGIVSTAGTSVSVLEELLFESFCILTKSYDRYRLISLDAATSGDTWTNPLKQGGREIVSAELTPLDNVYTHYTIKFQYEASTGNYNNEYFCNPFGYTTGLSLSTQQTACQNAVINYNVKRRDFIHLSKWINKSGDTAQALLKKIIAWYSKQRLMVTWGGDIATYLKYEIGDQVKINYSKLIPNALNNSAYFMIMSKEIVIKRGDPHIIFSLIQVS